MKNILKFCIPAFFSLLYSWHPPQLYAGHDPNDLGNDDFVIVGSPGATGPIRLDAAGQILGDLRNFYWSADGISPDTAKFGAFNFSGPAGDLQAPSIPGERIVCLMKFETVVAGTFCIDTSIIRMPPDGQAPLQFVTPDAIGFAPHFSSIQVVAPAPSGTPFTVPVEVLNDGPLRGIGLFFEIRTCSPGFARFLGFELAPEEQIPTLTEWGLIIFSLLLLGTIVWYLRKRRLAPASLGIFLLVFTLSFYVSSTL